MPTKKNKAPETNVKNFLSMIWGRYLLLQKMNEDRIWDEYGIFIYCRPDVCLNSPLDYGYISSALQTYDPIVPSNVQWRGGINDKFAIGGKKISIYLDLLTHIIKYTEKISCFIQKRC